MSGKRELRQITFSTYPEHVLDTSTDGTHILFEQLEERASLWMLHPESHTERQRLTQETAFDHWHSVSRDGTLLAFQRQESMLQNSDYYAAGIMLAELHGDELSNQRRVVRVGGAALLSPDGRWLAFARPAPGGYELCLLDPHSGHTWRAEQRFQPNTAWPFPQDWLGPNWTWSPDGAALYFVARSADGVGDPASRRRRRRVRLGTHRHEPGYARLRGLAPCCRQYQTDLIDNYLSLGFMTDTRR